jgi:Gpi18-like mannosyltransferase
LFVKPQLGGIILSNLCFIAAACIFYLLVKKLFNKSIALYSWLALLLFPTSYIFSAFMSESLFLLMLLLSIYFGFEKKWITAGIFGALLSATRNTGILVIIPLIIIFLQDELGNKPFKFKHLALIFNKRFILTLILVPLGLVFFMFFLGKTINDPFGFINIQRFWEKPVNDISILLAIPYSFINWELEGSFNIHLYNLFYFLLYVSLFIYGYYKKVIPVSLLSILPWLFIPLLAGTMLALPRYLSVLFPIYILIGILLSKHKVIAVAFYILSGLLSLYPLYSFIQGYWVAV